MNWIPQIYSLNRANYCFWAAESISILNFYWVTTISLPTYYSHTNCSSQSKTIEFLIENWSFFHYFLLKIRDLAGLYFPKFMELKPWMKIDLEAVVMLVAFKLLLLSIKSYVWPTLSFFFSFPTQFFFFCDFWGWTNVDHAPRSYVSLSKLIHFRAKPCLKRCLCLFGVAIKNRDAWEESAALESF